MGSFNHEIWCVLEPVSDNWLSLLTSCVKLLLLNSSYCIFCAVDCVLIPRNHSRFLDFLTWCLAVKYLEPFMKCIMSPISRKHAVLFDFSECHSHNRKQSSLFWFCVAESITPTVELNALCMKLGKKPMYKPVDPYSRMQSTYNYNMRGGAYPPRYVSVLF